MFSSIWQKIKEILKRMIGSRTIEQEIKVAPLLSTEMEQAIQMWSDMYKNKAPWIREPSFDNPNRVVSLGLPAMIASEKARMVLLEMQSEITAPTEEVEEKNPDYEEPKEDDFGNLLPSVQPETITVDKPIGDESRAQFLNEQYQNKLKPQLRKQLEYAIAKGGLVIKPYLVQKPTVDEKDNEQDEVAYAFEFDFIQADSFYPLSFNASGDITEAAFIQTKTSKDVIYRRLEYHKLEGSSVKIINKAYKSTNTQNRDDHSLDLGKEVPLAEVPEWKDIQPTITIKNITKPLFVYFKMPEANTIDTSSPLGVSGYSRAVSLIKDADMQYSRLLWEYEAGEMAVNIDRDAFTWLQDKTGDTDKGRSQLGSMQQRLYRQIDINNETELFEPYAPSLRDTQYIQGLNTILMRIEDVTGLSRGTLSDAASEARTATELKILKQRSFSVNAEIQHALELALKDVIYVMNVYCDLYEITPDGEYDVSFEWDDSIIVDVDTELGKRITLMQNGLASKLETRMWYFGETERQAKQSLLQIDEESSQSMEQDLAMQSNQMNMGFNPSNNKKQEQKKENVKQPKE